MKRYPHTTRHSFATHDLQNGGAVTDLLPQLGHADNGGPMKASTLLAKLEALGVATSYSRPRTSHRLRCRPG